MTCKKGTLITIDIFLFVTAIISLMVTSIVLYIICKHTKLKSLVNQSYFTTIKRKRCCNQTGTCLIDTWYWIVLVKSNGTQYTCQFYKF